MDAPPPSSTTPTKRSAAARPRYADRLVIPLLLTPTLAGLLASAILLVDYIRPVPVFCADGGGCDAVRKTAFAHWSANLFGRLIVIPTPALGLLGFIFLLTLLTLRGPRVRMTHAVVAGAAGALALILIAVQIQIGAFCKFCMVADISAIVVVAGALLRMKWEWDFPGTVWTRVGVATWGVVATGGPLAFGLAQEAPIPTAVFQEIQKSDHGTVTVVDFADFECPYCRIAHKRLEDAVASIPSKVRIVRKHVPLSMHSHATDAACAGICGESLGKGDEFADALFAAPVTSLTPSGCEEMAKKLGLDVEKYRACVNDPATKARITSDTKAFRDGHGRGLPSIWIDRELLEGAQEQQIYQVALQTAAAKQH